jgi:methyl-accepting chemotaxis protein
MTEEILSAVVKQEQTIMQITQEMNGLSLRTKGNMEKVQHVVADSAEATASAQGLLALAKSLEEMAINLTSATEKFKQ